MTSADLVRMSTQIAQFFEPYPEADAVTGVVKHLRQFWDPSMRAALLVLHREGNAVLHPLVVKASVQLAAQAP
jgi:formate dehydrogenase subunit delta